MASGRWLTFDCFGTLIDWTGGFRSILKPIAGDRVDELMNAYHNAEPVLEAETPHRLYREVLTTGLARAANTIGLPLDAADTDILVRRWADQSLFSDVPNGLHMARQEGWKIGILTNCDDDLFEQTLGNNASLSPDIVVTAQQVESYKPSFGHFARFEEETGVARSDWVHVANSWFHDIEPAQRYGIQRVWVNRDRSNQDPTIASRVIKDISDLASVVASVAG